MKYKQHIVDYAIDNKMSLEEAYDHFIRGEEKKIEAEDNLSPGEEDAWAKYQQIQKDLERLVDEYNKEQEITKEEMDWVEEQLRQIDELA